MNSLVNSSLATKLVVNDLVAKYGSKPSKDVEIRILENEKAIEAYLPKQMSEAELRERVQATITQVGASD